MRIANVENYKTGELYDTLQIKDVDLEVFRLPILTLKDKVKAIKTIETIVRGSLEYKDYIKFLKENIDMTKCTYFNKVGNDNQRRISIEIHHEPFTLYDITQIVMDKHLSFDEPLDEMKIAEEVMELHYTNLVGLLPLSKTVHELVHTGKIFIPLQILYGNYLKFVEEYDEWITEDLLNILQTKLEMSKEVMDNSILEKKFIYLEVDGFSLPQIMELKDK